MYTQERRAYMYIAENKDEPIYGRLGLPESVPQSDWAIGWHIYGRQRSRMKQNDEQQVEIYKRESGKLFFQKMDTQREAGLICPGPKLENCTYSLCVYNKVYRCH